MPKVLKAYNTNYKIASQPGGTITLDTGFNDGEVVVTGDLIVQGNTVTVNTSQLDIEDNIIVLNKGENDQGVTKGTSGIEIDRGGLANAQWIFDENVSWNLGGFSSSGTFYGIVDGQKLPINTPGIVSQGNLYVDTGAGVISVTGTLNYKESVFNYEQGEIKAANDGSVIKDDDHIPNAKSVVDYVSYSFSNNLQPSIQQGNTKVEALDSTHFISSILSISSTNNRTVLVTSVPHGFESGDFVDISGIDANEDPIEGLDGVNLEITDILNQFSFAVATSVVGGNTSTYVPNSGVVQKTSAEESKILLSVEDTAIAEFYSDRFVIEDIEISNNEIKSLSTNNDLTLKSAASGTVKIDDVLELTAFPWENQSSLPLSPLTGVKIYTTQTAITGDVRDQTLGKSGIFFVNSNNDEDELVSRRRSLLYSMIF